MAPVLQSTSSASLSSRKEQPVVYIDLCVVNKAVVPDRYPLPTMEELTTHFSKLDLCQGYLPIPLHPESKNLSAFVTHAGLYCYTTGAYPDNSPQFLSAEFSSYLATKCVTHIWTSVFQPKTNEWVKRSNHSLKNGLRMFLLLCSCWVENSCFPIKTPPAN